MGEVVGGVVKGVYDEGGVEKGVLWHAEKNYVERG